MSPPPFIAITNKNVGYVLNESVIWFNIYNKKVIAMQQF